MNYEIVTRKSCKVIGLQVELTTSQNENHRIIASHWKRFNRELRIKGIRFDGSWLKYGITKKINDQYMYLSAIPKTTDVAGFAEEELRGGEYICFAHRGNMGLLKLMIHEIYKEFIPESDFELDASRATIHFEQYDHRFLWNKPNSIIDIYVPIKSAKLPI
ncbi:MAG: effector binding domain-containing protein [Gammaproteobacteria bacterium]|nr:effector binding domain-containing protein [Gammaproteobacteria bacterium]